ERQYPEKAISSPNGEPQCPPATSNLYTQSMTHLSRCCTPSNAGYNACCKGGLAMNRRSFLRSAGAVFAGCSLCSSSLRAQATRRKVTVGGRRVKTIDIHSHVVFPEATALMGTATNPGDPLIMAPSRFDRMDEWGTDMQALSINATWYGLDRDRAT